jgi:hypothetical protein
MPKAQEFNPDNFSKQEIISIIKIEISKEVEKIDMFNSKVSVRPDNLLITLSDEHVTEFQESNLGKQLMFKIYEEKKEKLIAEYNKLKDKLDFCLHDVSEYNKLCAQLDELTYCSAINELRKLDSKYIYSKAVSKAIYRSRSREYLNIKCN